MKSQWDLTEAISPQSSALKPWQALVDKALQDIKGGNFSSLYGDSINIKLMNPLSRNLFNTQHTCTQIQNYL